MNNVTTNNEPLIACPFCESTDTEFFSLFGQFLLSSQYYCRNCRTVFDVVRWEDELPARNLPESHHGGSGL